MGFSVVIPTSASMNANVEGEAVLAAITGANATLTASVAIPGPQGPQGPAGPAGADEWGQITGTLSDQTDLQSALDAKYDASNPSGFQTASEVSSSISTAVADYLPLAGGTLTGNLSVTATSNSGLIAIQADEGSGDAGILVDNGGGQQSRLYSGYVNVNSPAGYSTLNSTSLTITDGTTSVAADASSGFKFPDGTWQSTAAEPGSYLKTANNLVELSGTASIARSNLGLGTMAVATATDYLDKAGNLAGIASPSLARGNLGLGTAAVESVSYWIQSPSVAATDGQIPAWDAATSRPVWIDNSARSLFLVGVNKSGATIPKGAAVYISGGQGGTPIISLAQANSDATSAHTIGITTAAIANNAQGNVVVAGTATKLDTSAYSDGQILYLSPTVAGGFVTSLPTQPYHGVVIGYVTRSNNSNGTIEVAINNYQELSELSDVLISSEANGDLLSWDATAGVWRNRTVAALGLLTTSAASATYAPLSGATFTGPVNTPASTTASSGFNIAPSTSFPTSPNNGDIWFTGSNMIARVGGATKSVAFQESASIAFTGTSFSAGTSIFSTTTNINTGATQSASVKTVNIGTGSAAGSTTNITIGSTAGTSTTTLQGTTNGVTQSVGDNSTKLATTAFVTAAVPAFATNAQAVKGDSSTLVVNPTGLDAVNISTNTLRFFSPAWSGATSGTGAGGATVFGNQRVYAPTTAIGYAYRNHPATIMTRANPETSAVNFSKRITWGFRTCKYNNSTSPDTICRIIFGKNTGAIPGNPTTKAIGISFAGNGVVKLIVNDGTTFRSFDTTFTPAYITLFDCVIISDGAGNVSLYINGTLQASTSLGPVGLGVNSFDHRIECENTAVIATPPMGAYYANQTLNVEV